MFSKIREKIEQMLHSKHAATGTFLASLAETTFVPIPIEVVLLPVMIANRRRAWWYAAIALAGCLFGAVLGYWVGYVAFDTVGQWFIEATGNEEEFEKYTSELKDDGFAYIFLIAVIPVPFQIAFVGAGMLKYSFPLFLLASLLGRSIRYFGLAALVFILGHAARDWLEKHETTVAIATSVVFIGGYLIIRFFFA